MIFVDTWAWLALVDQRDPYHRAARQQHAAFRQAKQKYVTTDYVLSEAISSVFGSIAFSDAVQYIDGLLQSFDARRDDLIYVSPAQFRQAWGLRQRYHDKPDISFVDLTSMVVMRELGLADIFTGDSHFLKVGLGFHLYPDPTARTSTS